MASNKTELQKELIELSERHPNHWISFYSVFGRLTYTIYVNHPKTNEGEDCYREFGGFFKNGKIVTPDKSWLKVFNYIPCGDR